MPKPWATGLFFGMLLVVFLLFYGRKYASLRVRFISELLPDYQFNISNFSITYLIYAGVGYMWLLFGIKFQFIAIFGIVMIAVNLIYELWIPILNTKDTLDAYFGIAGAIVAFLFLAMVKKYGLLPTKHI